MVAHAVDYVYVSADEALRWYHRAAAAGLPAAMFNVGLMSAQGHGTPQDHREAARWYRRAAEGGHPLAMLNLGMMYADGRGVPQDCREAVNWYRKAADKGNPRAMFNLGLMYQQGRGVPRDDAESYAWFSVAAAFGQDEARRARDLVGEALTADARLEAQQRARESFEQIAERGSNGTRPGSLRGGSRHMSRQLGTDNGH